jgi:hypothetical protein
MSIGMAPNGYCADTRTFRGGQVAAQGTRRANATTDPMVADSPFQLLYNSELKRMGRVGVEPTTLGLKGPCSTAELPARRNLAVPSGPINA